MIRLIVLLLAVILLPRVAMAHETTRSYLTLTRDQAAIDMTLSIAFRDLEVAIWLDENLDGRIRWAEVQTKAPAINAYALAGLRLAAGGICHLAPVGQSVRVNGGIDYLDLRFAGTCPDPTNALTVSSRLFAQIDPDHRMLLTARSNGRPTTSMLGTQQPDIVIDTGTGGLRATFLDYLQAGVAHLAGGADHIVFLLVLMLPAITAHSTAANAVRQVVLAATGFTIAHALTLTAATFDFLRPQSIVIECLIALSIIVTALDNIRPFIPAPRAAVAAFFGLIHGFGFATVLGGLTLAPMTLAVALVGFNIGIELAQIALILFTLPALYMLRAGRYLVWPGSFAAIVAGSYWLVMRLGA